MKTKKKIAYVTFRVSFEVQISYTDLEDLQKQMANIQIPEGDDDTYYKEDSLELVSCEDRQGNKIELS